MAAKKGTTKTAAKKAPAKKAVAKKKATKKRASRKVAAAPVEPEPHDAVRKITHEEALTFGKLDAETRNAMQAIKILDLEVARMDNEYKLRRSDMLHQKKSQENEVHRKRAEYVLMVTTLAAKYDLDKDHLGIDPETGTIHDLRTAQSG